MFVRSVSYTGTLDVEREWHKPKEGEADMLEEPEAGGAGSADPSSGDELMEYAEQEEPDVDDRAVRLSHRSWRRQPPLFVCRPASLSCSVLLRAFCAPLC